MKKTMSIALLLAAFAGSGFAQGFYFKVGLGYDFAQAGQSMYDTPIPYNGFPTGYNGSRNNNNNIQTYNVSGASFSTGIQAVLGAGYMFNENVGIQLDGGIGLSAKKYTFHDNNVNLSVSATSTIPYNITTTQQANTPFFLMPSLVLQTGNTWKIYSRLGLVLPLSAHLTQDEQLTNAPGMGAVVTDDFTWNLKTSFSLGFTAAAGVKYKINDKVSLWGEVSMVSMSLYAKEQDLKSWTETQAGVGSQSVPLSNYSNAAVIKFSKTATVDSNLASFPTYSIPFSNVGFHFGITFNLSQEADRHTGGKHNEDIDQPNKPFRRR